MEQLSESEWDSLLDPYLAEPLSAEMRAKLAAYLELLLRWNARMNLTAIREPREIVRRHFGESLFAARNVPRGTFTLLDHGSGAGFPGLPIALARPEIAVTLSEAQSKKAAFLREASRQLAPGVIIHSSRTEDLPAGSLYDIVTMRAVDHAIQAYPAGFARVRPGGYLLAVESSDPGFPGRDPDAALPIPGSPGRLRIYRR
jgi:16S rRNA (guanine527-N7)-methyltransferase